jgi:hypothetical protein
MKAVYILSSLFLLSVSAWAQPTLEEALQDRSLIVSAPVFNFGYALVKVNDLCTDGTNIRPVNPYFKVCIQHSGRDNKCTRHRLVYLTTPIRHTVSECKNWRNTYQERRCTEWAPVEKDHPLTFEIPAYRTGRRDVFNRAEFTIDYTIPVCIEQI